MSSLTMTDVMTHFKLGCYYQVTLDDYFLPSLQCTIHDEQIHIVNDICYYVVRLSYANGMTTQEINLLFFVKPENKEKVIEVEVIYMYITNNMHHGSTIYRFKLDRTVFDACVPL